MKVTVNKDGTIIGKRGWTLSQNLNNCGYLTAKVDGRKQLVHRLVAETHIPNPNNLPCINHKDEDKTNNHADNLEWCDYQYNSEYSLSKSYKFIDPNGEVREVFNLRKFCRANNLHSGCMSDVNKGKQKQHKGWTKFESY